MALYKTQRSIYQFYLRESTLKSFDLRPTLLNAKNTEKIGRREVLRQWLLNLGSKRSRRRLCVE